LSLPILLIAAAVVLVAAVIQASVGFGANILAVPILLLLDPRLVPGPVILAVLWVNVAMLVRDRRATAPASLGIILSGRLVGTVAGVTALSLVGERGLAILVAATVLAVVGVMAKGLSVPRTTRNMVAAGLISGFSASTAGIGGPPLAVLYADAEGPEIRGSMGALFVVGNGLTLVGLTLAGLFGREELRLGLALAPAALLGFVATRWLVPALDRGHTRRAILVLSAFAAVGVLGRLLFG
jgi:uncharacterized protein